MKPLPWSYSGLDTHNNCPKQYFHRYVAKDLPAEEKSPQQLWGTRVHETFDSYLSTKPFDIAKMAAHESGYTLAHDMMIHKGFLDTLLQRPGVLHTEQKVALGRKPFGPCSYFDRSGNVWWRGIIDVQVIETDQQRATIVDFKTGKKFDKWDQLAMNAVWVFFNYPAINLINAQFYWTEDQTSTRKIWARSEMDALCEMFAPKLGAYVTSFQTDTFTPKQSGLCNGYCPVNFPKGDPRHCVFFNPEKKKKYGK